MKILFINDDGYDAIGIQSLYKEFAPHCDAYMCAPLHHKSAFSHAIYIHGSLELQELKGDVKGFALDGTPADCARASFNGLFDEEFDIVLSGINDGVNAAQDIFYSGTVGAARESSFQQKLAIAFSLDYYNETLCKESKEQLFTYTSKISRKIVESLPADLLSYKNSIININFPPTTKPKGIKLTDVGQHDFHTIVTRRKDNGIDRVDIDVEHRGSLSGEGTDSYHLQEGYIVVTALHQGVVLDKKLQEKLQYLEKLSLDI